jgi:hypothetical protein
MNKFTPRQILNVALRHSLSAFTHRCFQTVVPGETFQPNWHIDAITYALERVLRGEVRRRSSPCRHAA